MVARVALGLLAALAVIGGALLVVVVAVYFWAGADVPVLDRVGGWGLLAGVLAFGLYVGGLARAHPVLRVVVGALTAAFGLIFTATMAAAFSLTVHDGEPRAHLDRGVHGLIWVIAGLLLGWAAAKSRWPVPRAG